MKLRQQRNFEALVGDTFGFLGETWKHFFPTMLRVNFIYIIAVCVLSYLAFSTGLGEMHFPSGVLGHWGYSLEMEADNASELLQENLSVLPFIGLFGLLMLVGMLIFMAFTPVYMILYSRTGQTPSFRQIVALLKAKAARLLIYTLGLLLLAIPVIVVLIPLFLFLIVTIVGIALIPLVLLVLAMMSMLMLFAYLDDEQTGFFDSIDVAWRTLKDGFWKNAGANALIYVVGMFLVLLPEIFTSLFDRFALSGAEAPGMVFLGVVYSLAVLVMHLVISSFYSVNIGIIYMSRRSREQKFHIPA